MLEAVVIMHCVDRADVEQAPWSCLLDNKPSVAQFLAWWSQVQLQAHHKVRFGLEFINHIHSSCWPGSYSGESCRTLQFCQGNIALMLSRLCAQIQGFRCSKACNSIRGQMENYYSRVHRNHAKCKFLELRSR
jgi:hypothetical protein